MSSPTINEFRNCLKKSMLSSLDRSIDLLNDEFGGQYHQDIENHLFLLEKTMNISNFPQYAARAFIKFNKEILKEELSFRKSGHYSSSDFDQIKRDVYENSDVMKDYYLTGLYLTYFIWPHHYRLLSFFRKSFLENTDNVSTFMEWGVGHGLLSKLAFTQWPNSNASIYDISPFSLEFSKNLLKTAGFNNCSFFLGDVTSMQIKKADAIICGELLEHVPDPVSLLKHLKEGLNSGGKAFITGAVNSAQEDHLTLFTSCDEIFQLVEKCGLHVVDSESFIHPNRMNEKNAPTVVAIVIQ